MGKTAVGAGNRQLAVHPCRGTHAAAGFLSYDGLPFEKFVIIVLESTILYSGWRVWKTELRPKQKGKVKKIAFK